MENNSRKPIYVVYASNSEYDFGHTYFEDENQAKNYQIYKNKTKWSQCDNYLIKEVKIEDKNVDYSKIKLFLTVDLDFDNFDSSDDEIIETSISRELRYYEDIEKNQIYKKNTISITVKDYAKPEVSINYNCCINDEKDIKDLLKRINKFNEKILKEASRLSVLELKKNKNIKLDKDNGFIVSKILDTQFEKEVEMIING